MDIDLDTPTRPIRNWWTLSWHDIEFWWAGWRILHWWWAWHPVFVNGHFIWFKWLKRSYNTLGQRMADYGTGRYGNGRKWTYCLDPDPHTWADYSPYLKLIYGENPGRSLWRNSSGHGAFTETKFGMSKRTTREAA